jgi:ubiquinone/menaquinone biosynthesis C-methylase UbiE
MTKESDRVTKVPNEVISYYDRSGEERRLQSDIGQLEFVRTQEIIQRHILGTASQVLDIGGGAGVYAFWLASLGYVVHLIDATPLHIEQAKVVQSSSKHPLASVQVGDARQLTNRDNSIDVVLLLGPLYHLTDFVERLTALREAYRVLKPGGLLFAAAISRFSSFLDGIRQSRFNDAEFMRIVETDLLNGQHRNLSGQPGYFTTAYLHHPDEFGKEVSEAGFVDVAVLAIEGPGWLMPNFDQCWAHEEQRRQLLHFIKSLESDKSIMGASSHLMAVGWKPASE